MDLLRLGAREMGIQLADEQLSQFEAYYHELISWNRKVNLTRITSYDEVQVRHFLDSLTLAAIPEVGNKLAAGDTSMIDVGSGAGFPGLAIKIARPALRLTLLESLGKRTSFLLQVVQQLGLTGVDVVTGRAEDVAQEPRYREQFDLATGRAVAALPVLAEYCLPFTRVGGLLLAPKKGDVEAEIMRSLTAIDKLGGHVRRSDSFSLPTIDETRYVIVVEKLRATPTKYPRRPGVPAKRPLI